MAGQLRLGKVNHLRRDLTGQDPDAARRADASAADRR
jgi:hypothetical protein